MIILIDQSNTPYTLGPAMAIKSLGKSLPVVVEKEVNDICICDYVSCEYVENVFASPDSDDYKNDKNDFLFKRFISSDSIDLKLEREGVEVADLDDDTFGTLFNGFSNGNAEQQLYYGFVIDWKLVYDALGTGSYKVVGDLNILGDSSEFISREFNLFTYSDLGADNTVKIESTQNGNIIGGQFDFTGLEWKQYLRITGRFGNPTPIFETDRYVNQNQDFKQIKDTMSREWSLDTGLLSWDVAEKIVYNKLLANEILITDYSILAENIWRNIPVVLQSLDKPEIFNSPTKRYLFTFVDSRLIYQKRNF